MRCPRPHDVFLVPGPVYVPVENLNDYVFAWIRGSILCIQHSCSHVRCVCWQICQRMQNKASQTCPLKGWGQIWKAYFSFLASPSAAQTEAVLSLKNSKGREVLPNASHTSCPRGAMAWWPCDRSVLSRGSAVPWEAAICFPDVRVSLCSNSKIHLV